MCCDLGGRLVEGAHLEARGGREALRGKGEGEGDGEGEGEGEGAGWACT